MWYIAAAGVIAAGALAGFARSRGNGLPKAPIPGNDMDSETILVGTVQALSMEEIDFMLARLESEEPPEPVSGAMCYAPMAYPEYAEYICPVCGEKTLFSSSHISLIEWGLPGARRLGESINNNTEFNIVLDETLFCEFCRTGNDQDIEPALLLRVYHEDGSETVNSVSVTDLRMLDSFLQGRLFYITGNDGQMPLQEYTGRMRQLLGIQEDEE